MRSRFIQKILCFFISLKAFNPLCARFSLFLFRFARVFEGKSLMRARYSFIRAHELIKLIRYSAAFSAKERFIRILRVFFDRLAFFSLFFECSRFSTKKRTNLRANTHKKAFVRIKDTFIRINARKTRCTFSYLNVFLRNKG